MNYKIASLEEIAKKNLEIVELAEVRELGFDPEIFFSADKRLVYAKKAGRKKLPENLKLKTKSIRMTDYEAELVKEFLKKLRA